MFRWCAPYSIDSCLFSLPLDACLAAALARWNDTQIAVLNPGVYLPSQPITVVLQRESRSLMKIFTRVSGRADKLFSATIPQDPLPTWPVASYYSYVYVLRNEGPVSYVLDNPYSIGISSTGTRGDAEEIATRMCARAEEDAGWSN
jgi:hypothetical protein